MAGDSPAVILYDAAGKALAVEDGVAVPANQQGLFMLGKEGADARFISAVDDAGTKRLAVDAVGTVQVSATPVEDPALIFAKQLDDGGGTPSVDMLVDGSGTAVDFKCNPDSTDDIRITELRLVFVAGSIDFAGDTFGSGGGALSNGLLITIQVNDSGSPTDLENILINEDMLRFASTAGINVMLGQGGNNDVLVASFQFGSRMVIKQGSSDFVQVKVRDDLTQGNRILRYLTATLYGTRETP
jgi:hypothetical protein